MSNDEKNGADDAGRRERRDTPIEFSRTRDDTLKRIARLRSRLRESGRMHLRTDQLAREVGRLVEQGIGDDQERALLMRLGLHFEEIEEYLRDELAGVMGGTGRVLQRLSETKGA